MAHDVGCSTEVITVPLGTMSDKLARHGLRHPVYLITYNPLPLQPDNGKYVKVTVI